MFKGLKYSRIGKERVIVLCRKSHAPDVRVQLNVFDDQRETDEELTNHGPPGIDLSSHVDVFYAILGQVRDFVLPFREFPSSATRYIQQISPMSLVHVLIVFANLTFETFPVLRN